MSTAPGESLGPGDVQGKVENAVADDGASLQSASSEPASEPGSVGAAASPIAHLEHEGDIAADYLEALLDIADLDGDIDLDVENDRAMVSIVGAELQDLIGPGGRGLDALQELTRLAVLRETGERSRLMLDIAGTRARRKAELTQLAADTAATVRSSGEPVRMAPMNPFERKVVHDAVAVAGLRSESEGVEPERRVVIYPT